MIEAVSSNYLPLSYVYASRYSDGRMSVPVLRSQALYANFQHVSGIPAEAGAPAYSVDKLHMLDVLISSLQSVKTQPLAALEAPPSLNAGRVDALISQYSAEIHTMAAAPARPYVPMPAVQPGMLFSLAA